jgi:hypothetical protein
MTGVGKGPINQARADQSIFDEIKMALITNPAERVQMPVEFVSLTSQADLTSTNMKALERLHAMQQAFFGEGGRSLEHFYTMLALNDPAHPAQKKWGPTRYIITYAKRQGIDDPLGGTTYLVSVLPPELRGQYDGTIAVPYTFVAEHEQRSGLAGHLRQQRLMNANRFLVEIGLADAAGQARFLTFCEFEDPYLLTLDEHRASKRNAKIWPLRRAMLWYDVGYRSFDLDFYAELRGKDGAAPCYHYALNVLVGSPAPLIARDLLARHVTVQAAICRKHGDDPKDDPDHRKVIDAIMAKPEHVPEDRRDELRKLKKSLTALLQASPDPSTAHLPVRELLALTS